jgi:hypothetical protein
MMADFLPKINPIQEITPINDLKIKQFCLNAWRRINMGQLHGCGVALPGYPLFRPLLYLSVVEFPHTW